MASNPESPSLLAAASAIAITAICWWFANSLHPVWWLAWLAPIPLLVYAARARARQTALASFIALAIGNASIWHYLLEVIRLPLPVCLAAVFIPALLMLPPILLWRALVRAGVGQSIRADRAAPRALEQALKTPPAAPEPTVADDPATLGQRLLALRRWS